MANVGRIILMIEWSQLRRLGEGSSLFGRYLQGLIGCDGIGAYDWSSGLPSDGSRSKLSHYHIESQFYEFTNGRCENVFLTLKFFCDMFL